MPELPIPSKIPIPSMPGGQVDEEIFQAWKTQMIEGYQHNSLMFDKVLDAFMRPYWMTVWMYRLMFLVGIGGFILAAVLGVTMGVEFGLLFGGMTVASFLAFFVSKPLRSLEQNIQFITWLGIIYNTYWTRLMYANDESQVQSDLESITQTAIAEIKELVDKHQELSGQG